MERMDSKGAIVSVAKGTLILLLVGVLFAWECPNCGEEYYMDSGGWTTCIGWQPIYKDGKMINEDPNITSWERKCLGCGKSYAMNSKGKCLEIEPEDLIPMDSSITLKIGTYEYPKAFISFTFDDGDHRFFYNAFPTMNRYGFVGTMYLMTEYIGESWCISFEQMDLMFQEGWEVGAHTHTHPHLTKVSDEELAFELDKPLEILEKYNVKSFATPHGDYDERVLAAIKERYQSHRCGWGNQGLNDLVTYDKYQINTIELDKHSVMEMKQLVYKAIQDEQWLVFLLHAVTREPTDSDNYMYNVQDFNEVLQFVSAMKDLGLVEVVTISQMLERPKFVRLELDTLKLKEDW